MVSSQTIFLHRSLLTSLSWFVDRCITPRPWALTVLRLTNTFSGKSPNTRRAVTPRKLRARGDTTPNREVSVARPNPSCVEPPNLPRKRLSSSRLPSSTKEKERIWRSRDATPLRDADPSSWAKRRTPRDRSSFEDVRSILLREVLMTQALRTFTPCAVLCLSYSFLAQIEVKL